MADHRHVVVVGLGPWGASAARALARAGHRVTGIDTHVPPHAFGSHTGRTRTARRSAHSGPVYTDISCRAFALWDELESVAGRQVTTRTGALLLDRPDGPLIEDSRRTLLDGGWEFEELDHAAMRARFPGIRLLDGEIGVFEHWARVIDAPAAIQVLHDAARSEGAALTCREMLVDWEANGDRILVRTAARTLVADTLVLCVGNRAAQHLHLDLPLEVERQVLVAFRSPPQLMDLPIVMAVAPGLGPRSGFYGCQDGPGRYKVALHHEGMTGDPDTLPREVRTEDLAAVRAVVDRRLPDLGPAVLDAQTCTYTNTPDLNWVLDAHPDHPNVLIATGDSGRGFRYAPAVGEILAGIVDGRPAPQELRIGRFTHA
ncbi:N-methyl-L-tryptophan oxidase [Mycobacterium sp. ML4]